MPEDHMATVTAGTGMTAGLGAGLPTGMTTCSGTGAVPAGTLADRTVRRRSKWVGDER